MRLLVTGGNGLLGSNVVASALGEDHDVVVTYHRTEPAFDVEGTQLDITDTKRVTTLLDTYAPDAVINCAAMTDVDGCERDPERAQAVNAIAPDDLATATAAREIAFVHVSTDYVFDGTADRPYSEDAEPNPLQVYGQTKLAGEQAVINEHPTPLVVRLSFVYGRHGATNELQGFPRWVRARLRDGEATPLFTDQHVTPTRAGQAADTLLLLLQHSQTGRVHVACRSCVTPSEFGHLVADTMAVSPDMLVEESMVDLDRPAERPHYICLEVSRVSSWLDCEQPTLTEDIKAIL